MMKRSLWFVVLLAGFAVSGCSSGSSPASPAAVTSATEAGADTAARGIEISGTISRIGGSCPAVRFLVGRVTVQTDRATDYAGGTCARLAGGTGVVVRGSRQRDGSLLASSVTVRGRLSR